MPDLSVRLGDLTLPNPVLTAAGTFGCGVEFTRSLPLERLGGVITKTLTQNARDGYPPPRLVETPSGMLNAVGLANPGLEHFLKNSLAELRTHKVPVIVSLLAESAEIIQKMAQRASVEGVSALELNLSCPNAKAVSEHRSRFVPTIAQDPEAAATVVQAARSATTLPLIAKLSPDVTDLTPVAQAVERAGATAVSISNTYVGMSVDPGTRRSRLGAPTGGLSGPAIRPLSLYRVWYTVENIRIPVIGIGGIVRAEDAIEYFIAGASAVAIGTANFANPRATLDVVRGIERYLARHGLASMSELRGSWRHA